MDGYNLYYGRLRGTAFKLLDLPLLFDRLLAIQDPLATLVAVKFFSATALGNFASHGQLSVESQDSYHRALAARHPDRFSIKLGTHSMDRNGSWMPAFVDGQRFDRKVQTRVWRIEEKKTDVNLAMSMYRDICKGLYGQVVLCSNDSDAEPVLEALREDFPELVIGIVTPVKPPTGEAASRRHSASLARHAHWTRRYILDEELAGAQLPPVVPTKKKPIRKPTHW
ncbi:acetyltransferase [Variovorax sp. UMC13]|nr:acetyltransferase [Variovorax sp. UMC13]